MTEEIGSTDTSNRPEANETGATDQRPKSFGSYIYITFFWSLMGVAIIYGIRFWNDAPLSQSFMPIVCGLFAALVSFTLVMALEHVIGPIKIEASGIKFHGASGPIVMWCMCFLVISFGLYLFGAAEVAKQPQQEGHRWCPTGKLIFGECSWLKDAEQVKQTKKQDEKNSADASKQ